MVVASLILLVFGDLTSVLGIQTRFRLPAIFKPFRSLDCLLRRSDKGLFLFELSALNQRGAVFFIALDHYGAALRLPPEAGLVPFACSSREVSLALGLGESLP